MRKQDSPETAPTSGALVPSPHRSAVSVAAAVPDMVLRAGPSGRVAWEEFFVGQLRNPHTRTAYLRAVSRFLDWIAPENLELPQITPGMVGAYFDQHAGSVPTRK